jgi:hypothetical protein
MSEFQLLAAPKFDEGGSAGQHFSFWFLMSRRSHAKTEAFVLLISAVDMTAFQFIDLGNALPASGVKTL